MGSARRRVVALAVAGSVLAGCSSSSTTANPPSTTNPANNVTKVLYVAPSAAGTALGNANIARFQRLVDEGLNQGHLQVMDEVLSPTVVDHQNYGPGYPPSRAGVKGLTAALRTAFPDLHATASTLVATNDGTQTFAIIKTTGTNTGPFLGVPPTGRQINLDIEESARWQDGKMVEHWGVADNVGLLTQMGFFPPDAFPSYTPTALAPKFQSQLASPRPLQPITALTVDDRLAAIRHVVNDGVNGGDMYASSDVAAPGYVDHEYYGNGFPDGVSRAGDALAVNQTALPDLHTSIHILAPIGDGSMVFGILEAKGTNTGKFLGIPPTGRPVDIDLFEFYRFNSDGKIVEHNGVADLLGLIGDLGFVPPNASPVYSKDKVDQQFRAELDLG